MEIRTESKAEVVRKIESGYGAKLDWQDLIERMHEGFVACELVRADDDPAGEPIDFRYIYANPAFTSQTGLEPEVVLGRRAADALPGLEPEWTEDLVRVGVTQQSDNFTRFVGLLGRWFEVHAFPLGHDRFGVLFLDTTEREQADILLQARTAKLERRLTATVSNQTLTWEVTPDLLSVIKADGAFEQTNPAWETVLGYTANQLNGKRFLDFVHPDDKSRTVTAFEKVVKDRQPVLRFENRYCHADGGWRWLSWVAVPENGQVFCSARDVTADKASESKLAQRNRFWNASRDLHVIVDFDGRCRELNPAWQTELGYVPEALIGEKFSKLVRHDQVSSLQRKIDYVLTGGRLDGYELALLAADGLYRWYSFTAFTEGDAMLATGRDVSEEIRRDQELAITEGELRHSQKLDMVGQLTGGIAHDFNNLLTAVQSNLELLDSTLASDDSKARLLVSEALAGTVRGGVLTQRLLAFARKQDLTTGSVDVGQLIEGMKDLLTRSLGPGVHINTTVAEGTSLASVDSNQLDMALLNLAVNARDAMDGEGSLSFAIEPAHVYEAGPLPAGDYVRILVTDTGCGMDNVTVEKATEPFFTTKDLGMGTGLGLSMVHGLAEQSGGKFRLTSELGVGSIAELLLPAATGPADVPSQEHLVKSVESGSSVTCRRVLVVDDDALVLRAMAATLRRLGHVVYSAESGEHALEVLAQELAMDVVITDQLMRGMSGLKLAADIRQNYGGTAVILATGYVGDNEIEHGLIDGRLVKPFNRASLNSVLASVLNSK